MGALTAEMGTIPLPVWVDMRKVNTDHIVGAVHEQQVAAAETVKKGVRIVKVQIPLTLYSRIFMFRILTFHTTSSENQDKTTWLARQLPSMSLLLCMSLSSVELCLALRWLLSCFMECICPSIMYCILCCLRLFYIFIALDSLICFNQSWISRFHSSMISGSVAVWTRSARAVVLLVNVQLKSQQTEHFPYR